MIAALYVATGGAYFGLDGVDPWDEARDARLYDGPYPVVAHPPCERWGAFWYGSPLNSNAGIRRERGDDGGCFFKAIDAVRRWGGVLEHPASSSAWPVCRIDRPLCGGGWSPAADGHSGWTCRVEQGHYGHRARKATWLYVNGGITVKDGAVVRVKLAPEALPSLIWGRATAETTVELMSRKQRRGTPTAFRDLLLSIATAVRTARSAA